MACERDTVKNGQSFGTARQQHGIAVMGVALLLAMVCAALWTSVIMMRKGVQPRTAVEKVDTLSWATRAVGAFSSIHGRYPCPAEEKGGEENCSHGHTKGWLPVETLRAYVAGHEDAGNEASLAVRYLVYRGDGSSDEISDLAVQSNAFIPTTLLGETMEEERAYPKVTGLPDLCAKLRILGTRDPSLSDNNRWLPSADDEQLPLNRQAAWIEAGVGTSSVARNVAYAIAVADPLVQEELSGINADFSVPTMASPDLPQSASYTDVVYAQDFRQAFHNLGCSALVVSLDSIANAQLISDWAEDAQEGTQEYVEHELKLLAQFITSDTLELVSAGIEFSDALFRESLQIAEKVALIPLLPWSLPRILVLEAALIVNDIGKAEGLGDMLVFGAEVAALAAYIQGYREIGERAGSANTWHGLNDMLRTAESIDAPHEGEEE